MLILPSQLFLHISLCSPQNKWLCDLKKITTIFSPNNAMVYLAEGKYALNESAAVTKANIPCVILWPFCDSNPGFPHWELSGGSSGKAWRSQEWESVPWSRAPGKCYAEARRSEAGAAGYKQNGTMFELWNTQGGYITLLRGNVWRKVKTATIQCLQEWTGTVGHTALGERGGIRGRQTSKYKGQPGLHTESRLATTL